MPSSPHLHGSYSPPPRPSLSSVLRAREGQKQAWMKEKTITQGIKKGALLKRTTAHRSLSPHTLQQERGTSTCGPQMQARH